MTDGMNDYRVTEKSCPIWTRSHNFKETRLVYVGFIRKIRHSNVILANNYSISPPFLVITAHVELP